MKNQTIAIHPCRFIKCHTLETLKSKDKSDIVQERPNLWGQFAPLGQCLEANFFLAHEVRLSMEIKIPTQSLLTFTWKVNFFQLLWFSLFMDQLYDTFLGTWPRARWVFLIDLKDFENRTKIEGVRALTFKISRNFKCSIMALKSK